VTAVATYNNKINKDSTNFMRNINNKLQKITILSELNVEGKSKTTRAKLLSKGFDFDFFTNILKPKQEIPIISSTTRATWF
jgi:hypothetical protein